jgi:acyl-CoA reductase-like NAD-dependent aldehyde dehydrogenase
VLRNLTLFATQCYSFIAAWLVHATMSGRKKQQNSDFRRSMATVAAPRVYKNFINGEWVSAKGGKAYENHNPANSDELVGMFVSSGAEDVDAAVEAATEAYKSWRLVPAPKRAEILYRTAELLVQRKEEFSKDMTREMGKVLAETRGDVQEAIDMTYYYGKGAALDRPHLRSCRTNLR